MKEEFYVILISIILSILEDAVCLIYFVNSDFYFPFITEEQAQLYKTARAEAVAFPLDFKINHGIIFVNLFQCV